jgi:hypothetical protein
MPYSNPKQFTEHMKAIRHSRRLDKLCIKCGKPEYKWSFCELCYEKEYAKKKRLTHNLKITVISKYGGKCICCNETHIAFLTLDHKDGDGAAHRKTLSGGDKGRFYKWVRRNNFPDFLQLLCWNCNMGKQINGGVCPHQAVL